MPYPKDIDRQVQLERKSVTLGLEKLHKNTKKLEEKAYASASVYGVNSIEVLLPLVIEQLEVTQNRIREGHTGVAFKEIHQYLDQLEPLATAGIACKILFDFVFSCKPNDNKLVNISLSIGKAIESECQMRYYERECPGLLKTIKKRYWHKSIGTHQKKTVTQTLINRSEVTPWKCWGSVVNVKLGGWLIDSIIQVSGWFEKQLVRSGKKTDNIIVPTEAMLNIKDELLNKQNSLHL